jgi:hypothetical protein
VDLRVAGGSVAKGDTRAHEREEKQMVFDDEEMVKECEWLDVWCDEHHYLMEREEFDGLLGCCLARLRRNPDDPCAVDSVAEAYLLKKDFEEALRFIMPYYECAPDNPDFQASILEALSGMGRSADDFPWKIPPVLVQLDESVLDECYRFLKSNRKPRSVFELLEIFLTRGHVRFSEDDLYGALILDKRFLVQGDESDAEVSVRRASRRRG